MEISKGFDIDKATGSGLSFCEGFISLTVRDKSHVSRCNRSGEGGVFPRQYSYFLGFREVERVAMSELLTVSVKKGKQEIPRVPCPHCRTQAVSARCTGRAFALPNLQPRLHCLQIRTPCSLACDLLSASQEAK